MVVVSMPMFSEEAVGHVHTCTPFWEGLHDWSVKALHVAGTAVADEQRDAMLIEGRLTLSIDGLEVELHARGVGIEPSEDLE
jgi:hypothetical protein